MLASEMQMKQLQASSTPSAHRDEDGQSDEGDDDGGASANANLLAMQQAGFHFNQVKHVRCRIGAPELTRPSVGPKPNPRGHVLMTRTPRRYH